MGEPALFECAVEANPMTSHTIRWERRATKDSDREYRMDSRTETTKGLMTRKDEAALMLTVLNSTARDSGVFVCVADNGIGNREERNETFLLVRRKLTHFSCVICACACFFISRIRRHLLYIRWMSKTNVVSRLRHFKWGLLRNGRQ